MMLLIYTIAMPSDQFGIDKVLNTLLLVNLNKLLLINTKLGRICVNLVIYINRKLFVIINYF